MELLFMHENMTLNSPAFEHGEEIPVRYTCMGKNVSPPLHVSDLSPGTKYLVLIIEDVDAQPKPWTHWMVFNIPATEPVLAEATVPGNAMEGLANNHSFGYEGPCPKYFRGTHHYWFRIYGLDKKLDLPAASEREEVWQKMQGHITGEAFLLGLCTSASGDS